jgi:PAS domain S-box-containing protein
MKRVFLPLAFRLSLWFSLLAILTLLVVAFFLRRNVAQELSSQAAAQCQQEAQANSVFVSRQKGTALAEVVAASQPQGGSHFIVDQDGVYLAYPAGQKAGRYLQEDFSPETISAILTHTPGSTVDQPTGRILGYAPIPGTTWVDVIVISPDGVNQKLDDLTRILALLLIASLVIVLCLGMLIIWVVVGHPLRLLTQVIQQMKAGNLDYSLEPGNMDGELQLLAETLLQARAQVKNQLTGLENQVDELTRTNAALLESEQRYRAIFDSTTDAIMIQDLETAEILNVNHIFSELYGYSEEEARSLSMEEISSGIPPYTLRSFLRSVRRARMHGPQLLEWHARGKDGQLFWVELSLRVDLVNGKECALVVVRDVNARKRAEHLQVAVYRIFQSAQAAETLYELFSLIQGILEQLLPASNFLVALYDPKTDLFTYPYHVDQYDPWPAIHRPDHGLITYVMRSGEPLLAIPKTLEKLGIKPDVDSKVDFVDWLGAPLQTSSGILGVVAIKNYLETQRISEQDKETFSFLSTQIALAVERKRAEDALRESEARWRTLMENTPQLILTINRSGEIIFVNRTFQSFNREAMLGKSIFTYIPGADSDKKQETLLKVFSDRSTSSFETAIARADQGEGWFSCHISPVVDNGRVDLAIFNATDITDRKSAEAALRESEELYRRAIEAAGAVPYFWDQQSNTFRFMGAGIFNITGYTNSEINPELWDDLVEESFMLGEASGLTVEEASRLARSGKLNIWQCDNRIRTRDGRSRWVYDSALELTSPDGVSRGSIGILQDITSRKLVEDALRQSEYKFRSIVEQLSEGFALVDEEGRVLEWNRALEEMLGLKREEVIGVDFMEIISRMTPPEMNEKNSKRSRQIAFKKALKTGKSILFEHPIETVMLTESGAHIYIQQTIFPISTEAGFRIGALNRDVTQQKRAEAEIHELNSELENRVVERTAQLEAANKELEAFSYSISHDLRAPLRAIDGFGRMLADLLGSDGSEDARRYLGVIRDNAQQMGRLIDDLLSFSRLSRQPLRKLPLAPRELIDQVLVTLAMEQQGRNIDLMIDDLPVCLGDASLLKQVWMNLLSNALKFTRDRDPARIEIGFEKQDGEMIYFVKDNGAGFDMRYVDKLFGVFQRLHRPEDFEGTGVGLAVVQRIVRRHGGRAWAEGALGKGSSFYFSLPVE